MFDSVLDKAKGARSRFGTGAVISIGVHVGLVGVALFLSSAPVAKEELPFPKLVFAAAPRLPPPPLAKSHSNTPKKPKPVRRDVLVAPTHATPPPEIEPAQPEDANDDDDGAVPDGDPNGQIGGQVGGDPNSTAVGPVGGEGGGEVSVPFGEGMTRPDWHLAASSDPIVYSREAREAMVEGTMIVKCVISTGGRLTGCRIIKSLPFMDSVVLATMARWQVPPVTFQGRPVTVDYTFNLTLRLPR